jgi:hypothetical protein
MDVVCRNDENGTGYRLSCLYFGSDILLAKTAVRKQGLDFPYLDLLNELDTCELSIRLAKFVSGEIRSNSKEEFKPIFERFCEHHEMHPSHSMGAFPIAGTWNFKDGWIGR